MTIGHVSNDYHLISDETVNVTVTVSGQGLSLLGVARGMKEREAVINFAELVKKADLDQGVATVSESELLATVFRWDRVEARFDEVIAQLEPILPRHISRWKNMKMENWRKNIKATKYYARVRPKKIPEMLKKAMKLTNAEVEEYFGETLQLLEEINRE